MVSLCFCPGRLIISCDDLWTDHREKNKCRWETSSCSCNKWSQIITRKTRKEHKLSLANPNDCRIHNHWNAARSLSSKSVSPFTVRVSADVHKKHTQPKRILWTTTMPLLATILLPASADMLSIWQESQEEEDCLAKTQIAAIETTTRTTKKHSKIEQKWVHERANLRSSCSSPLDRRKQKTP